MNTTIKGGKSDSSGVRIGWDGVFDASIGYVVVVWAEGEIIDAVLQQDLHFFIFFFVVSSEHFQVLW